MRRGNGRHAEVAIQGEPFGGGGIASLPEVRRLIRIALEEDIGPGDITTSALVPARILAEAEIIARSECVIAGLSVAAAVFRAVDRTAETECLAMDGERAGRGRRVMRIRGPARCLLAAERTALNFLQRLSGIATHASEFVKAVKGTRAVILDTRKTTPGLRTLEKYAVACGGAQNHRMGLFDQALIKDNHRRLWLSDSRQLWKAVRMVRSRWPSAVVEIEVENEKELRDALKGEPDWILLDNMDIETIRKCVRIVNGRCKLEVSGGVSLKNVRMIAMTGVDAISAGAITHSSTAADFSMEFA